MIIVVIILLVAIIMLLIIYNMNISKKIDKYNNLNQKVVSLNVLQEFMDTISEEKTPSNKIRKINEILIEKYDIKYSTIVVYNGAEYIIKATNVDVKHWDTLKNLHTEEIFKEAIETATPKYITVEKEGERLPYQKMEFGRAKSAMFFPLYIDNVYIGYWIIESGKAHDFDRIDTTVLEVVKNNIISVVKTIDSQEIIENIVRDDMFTGLKSAEYLYAEGKRRLDKYTISSICMFEITNIMNVNEQYGRHTGNDVITKVSEIVKQSISPEYIFVRYMGPKFVLAFTGVQTEDISKFAIDIKENLEELNIKQNESDLYEDEEPEYVKPEINMVITAYYKGTALEAVTKKLEEYLKLAPEGENDINYI